MIPSMRDSLKKASMVSSSPMTSYFTLPKSCRKACSGPLDGVVQTACDRVDRSRLTVFILEHDAVEAVHDSFAAVLQAGCVVTQVGSSAQRLHAVDFHRVI